MIRKILLGLAFCLICPEALATIFAVVPTDRSQQYLGMVFGGSVGTIYLGGGASNPMLSMMFEQFNFIIVTVGVAVLSYIGIVSTINTAREGEAMGKKMSMWIAMRAFLGMLMMVPTPGTGYSVIQMTVLWIVLNGIGAANSIWNTVLTQIANGIAPVGNINYPNAVQSNNPQLRALATKVLVSSTCMAALNAQSSTLSANPQSPFSQGSIAPFVVLSNPVIASTTMQQSATIYVGVQAAGSQYSNICGSFTILETLNSSNNAIIPFTQSNLTQRLNIMVATLQTMFGTVSDAANLFANNQTASPGYVVGAINAYITNILQLATLDQQPSSGASQNILNNILPLGWIHAGSYYYQLMAANSAASTADNDITANGLSNFSGNTPVYAGNLSANTYPQAAVSAGWNQPLTGILTLQQATVLNNSINQATSYGGSDSYTPPALPPIMGNSVIGTGNGIADEFFSWAMGPVQGVAASIIQNLTSGAGDPLTSMANQGSSLMQAAETGAFAVILLIVAVQLGLAWDSCMMPFAAMVTSLCIQVGMMIAGLLILLWTAGATLGIYVPLIPYLVFTSTAIGWIIAVVEAVVGAPIIALGLVHPGGEEIGKVGPALSILANIFLRPTLMIFGFVLGANLLRAVLTMINYGFAYATQSGQTGGGSIIQPTAFSFISVLMLYAGFVIAATNKSFSLIYLLPDKIMRWMGASPETGDAGDMVKEAKGGFDTGAQRTQEALGAIHDTGAASAKQGGTPKDGGGGGGGGGAGGMPSPSPAASAGGAEGAVAAAPEAGLALS